jgi:Flp pilus assembly protein CpaB
VRNRSNLLVLLGIAFFVVGGIIVYVLTNDSGDSHATVAPGETTVVVATHDIASGAKVDEELKNGGLKSKTVASSAAVPGAIGNTQQIAGGTFVQPFADGNQVVLTGVQVARRGYNLPDGFEAIAVDLNFVPGVAGYVNPGDRINIFGEFKAVGATGADLPNGENAHLLLTNVKVLDVNTTVPANGTTADTTASGATSRPGGGGQIIYLLAVKTSDAEKLVYMEQGQALYATLVKDDAPPAGATGGADATNILAGDPASSAG